jgi:hypothetical protein
MQAVNHGLKLKGFNLHRFFRLSPHLSPILSRARHWWPPPRLKEKNGRDNKQLPRNSKFSIAAAMVKFEQYPTPVPQTWPAFPAATWSAESGKSLQ